MAYLPAPSTFTTLCADALPSELWAAVQGLLGKNGELTAENEKLKARVAELEEKAKRPAKTPANSSVPPSRGQKANRPADEIRKKRTKRSVRRHYRAPFLVAPADELKSNCSPTPWGTGGKAVNGW